MKSHRNRMKNLDSRPPPPPCRSPPTCPPTHHTHPLRHLTGTTGAEAPAGASRASRALAFRSAASRCSETSARRPFTSSNWLVSSLSSKALASSSSSSASKLKTYNTSIQHLYKVINYLLFLFSRYYFNTMFSLSPTHQLTVQLLQLVPHKN